MMRLILLFFMLFAAHSLCAQQPSMKLDCVSDSVRLGNSFKCTCALSLPTGASLRSLQFPLDSIKELQGMTPGADTLPTDYEILDYGHWAPAKNNKFFPRQMTWQSTKQGDFDIYLNEFSFVLWQPGVFLLPAMIAEVNWNAGDYDILSNERSLYVSLPNADQIANVDSTGLAPIKPIVLTDRKIDWLLISSILVASLALIFGIWYLLSKRKAKLAEPAVVIPLSAHEKAYRALAKIRKQADWNQGELKKYYDELTHVLRQYLEDRYDIPALESTTDEILRDLVRTEVPNNFKAGIQRLLPMTDMVKFAKAMPHEEEHPTWLSWVKEFVDTTKIETVDLPENKEDSE